MNFVRLGFPGFSGCIRALTVIGASFLAACSGEEAAPIADTASATATASASATATASATASAIDCEEGMALVEGDYCVTAEEVCAEAQKIPSGDRGVVENQCLRYVEPTKCFDNRRERLRFCMDRFEWPNERGELPRTLTSWNDARAMCSSKIRSVSAAGPKESIATPRPSSLTSTAYTAGIIQIMEEFGCSQEVATLGVSLFVLGFAIGPLLWAPLSELYGRQVLFIGTYAVLTAFNAGAAGANSIGSLLVMRFIAGTFGASPLTNAGGVIADIFPANQRVSASITVGRIREC